jgi:hypothetical protein
MSLPDTKEEEADRLVKAKTLFSNNITDSRVKTAIDGLPRGARVGQLCWSELREQLLHSSVKYDPNLIEVPRYVLPTGNLLGSRRSAFYDGKNLYSVAFACEVNDNATKVVSFEFRVGSEIPRSEWQSYHYPR